MADILIRGMEMPENCFDCPIFDNFCQERCGVTGTVVYGEIDPNRETLQDCPLVPLPAGHGRLGDLDALDLAFTSLRFNADGSLAHWDDRRNWCLHGYEIERLIGEAPTIVPAEGGTDNG